MKYIQFLPAVVTVLLPLPTMAANVYSGCSVPSLKSGHHTFFVDPANGSLSGDGSAAKPWRTLADVLNPANKLISTQGHAGAAYTKGTDTTLHPVNPNGPIKAGDVILLRSGDHGSPTISNMFNTDFITVAAAPGATPIIGKTAIVSSAKWMFQGLTFQGMASLATGATRVTASNGYLVSTGIGDWQGPTSDVVFDNSTFQSAGSTTGWTDFDWLSKPFSLTIRANSPCTSITSNHFTNILNAIGVTEEKVLVQGNTIENFSNDAIEITASNLLVKGNTIKKGLNTTVDPWHADGIQGWSKVSNGVTAINQNVVLDGNNILKTGDTKSTYLQGISVYDGKWNNLVVQNNVVVTNHWNAIAIYGAENSRIINNTVVSSDPTGHPSMIQVHDAKDGRPSSGVVVRNNISTSFDIAKGNTVLDHNIAAFSFSTYPNGTKTFTQSGTIGSSNSVIPAVLAGFMTVNTEAGQFDLRLRSNSVAIGFGAGSGAPMLDILGRARTVPIDLGAYAH